ncbi:MAG: DUF2256 domain-containing protein [Alphaproteobacteria bacterium]|nr:DUF2256 domain-containing protein [Alphaproteobacteria bacterium]
MAHKKDNLPEKICPICNRPFTWRKKWEKNWDAVKYCSKRCANEKSPKE